MSPQITSYQNLITQEILYEIYGHITGLQELILDDILLYRKANFYEVKSFWRINYVDIR